MLIIVLDLFATIYQGILFVYTVKRQFECSHCPFFYDVAFVVAYVSFFAIIQY